MASSRATLNLCWSVFRQQQNRRDIFAQWGETVLKLQLDSNKYTLIYMVLNLHLPMYIIVPIPVACMPLGQGHLYLS